MQFERQAVFWVAAGLIFVGLFWLLSPVLLPFVVGAGVAYLLDPLARRLTRRGMSRMVAALVILGGFVLIMIGFLLLVGPILVRQLAAFISDFIGSLPNYVQHIQNWIDDPSHPWLKKMLGDAFTRTDQSIGGLLVPAAGYLNGVVGSLLARGRALVSLFSLAIISPVVAFYLICDWDRMLATIDRLIPLPERDTVRSLACEIDASISAYLHGQSLVCLLLGTYYAIGLSLAGLHFALLIGVVAGVISFVPYVGSLTALLVSLGVAVGQFYPHWGRIVIVVAVVLLGQFIEGNILSPRILGKSVGLHPVWLIFALFVFGYLLGFVGLLLAVPLAAAINVLVRFGLERYRASTLYTGNGQH